VIRARYAGDQGVYPSRFESPYRHGLLPGVCDLGRAAAVYIHAAGHDCRLCGTQCRARPAGRRT